MAITGYLYAKFYLSALNKEIDWDSDDIRLLLTTNSYTPDQDVHRYLSSVTGEVVGTGYTAGGLALTAKTAANTNETANFDADDAVWSGSTITARRGVFYNRTPASDATRPLIGWLDFGADFASNAGAFTVTFPAGGIVSLAAANAVGFP